MLPNPNGLLTSGRYQLVVEPQLPPVVGAANAARPASPPPTDPPSRIRVRPAPELTLDKRRERRQLRREKQRENNVHRAAKMHAARLKREATSLKATAEPRAPLYVGCSGWRYWDWRNSFYAGVPQPDWFKHYLRRFDTVEINASFYSWPTVANVQAWQRGLDKKRFIYTVKVCELITHVKKFKGTKTLIKDFGMIADVLGDRMGCFLFQLSPSYRYEYAARRLISARLSFPATSQTARSARI
jgi:hypothetical protein